VGLIKSELWPPAARPPFGVYAILDGARDPGVHEAVLGSGLPQACLYAGQLPRELVETAPYLVKLEPDAPFTADLLGERWGKSWGIFALTTGALEEMRRHLRKFLKVEDAKGTTLIFRYYDPRVLRTYLPTCNASELAALFGPVSFFVAEGDPPTKLLRFHREADGTLGRAEVVLQQTG
jgi:hypothetical protein